MIVIQLTLCVMWIIMSLTAQALHFHEESSNNLSSLLLIRLSVIVWRLLEHISVCRSKTVGAREKVFWGIACQATRDGTSVP